MKDALARKWARNALAAAGANITTFDYYVDSATGNDLFDGKSQSGAFATIAPLLALSAGALDNKTIGFKAGQSYPAMDLAVFTANGLTITSYGAGNKPFFDCTAVIPASWTLDSTGIYKVTLARSANAKMYGNYFRNGVPMRKVEAKASLTGTGNYTVFVDLEQTAAPVLYMNAPSDPGADGATYRFSKYGWGVAVTGNNNRISGLWSSGNAHQDGSLNVNSPGSGAIGGNRLDHCRLDWGCRHNSLIGSGAGTSIAEYNVVNGARNDVESGQVINQSGGGLVFYSADQSAAACISRFNTFNGMGIGGYAPGSTTLNLRTNFIAQIAHDAVANRAMTSFTSQGNTFTDCLGTESSPGATDSITSGVHSRTVDMLAVSVNGSTTAMTGQTGSADRAYRFGGGLGGTVNLSGSQITSPDPGSGTAQAYYMTVGLTADMTINLNNERVSLAAFPTNSSPNKAVAIHERGALSITNSQFTITGGRIVGHDFPFGWRVGTNGTGSVTSSNNVWPYGVSFYLNGTSYSLAGIQALGKETGSTMQQPKAATASADFEGSTATLESIGWTRVSGTANSMGQNGGALATVANNRVVYKFDDTTAGNHNIVFTMGTPVGANFGLAICIVDGSNFIMVTPSTTSYAVNTWIGQSGGAGTQVINTSGITPAVGDKVRLSSSIVDAPSGKLLVCLYINDQRVGAVTVTSTVLAAGTGVGAFAWNGAQTDLIRDFAYGPN